MWPSGYNGGLVIWRPCGGGSSNPTVDKFFCNVLLFRVPRSLTGSVQMKTSARLGYASPVWKRAQVQGLKESRRTIKGDQEFCFSDQSIYMQGLFIYMYPLYIGINSMNVQMKYSICFVHMHCITRGIWRIINIHPYTFTQ